MDYFCVLLTDCYSMVVQHQFTLRPYPRGCHLITRNVLDVCGNLPPSGLMHVLIQHTSAGLTLNENADPSVREDMNSFLDQLVPENHPVYTHIFEGDDDMPAHLKASLIGSSVTIPITNGRLNLGTWQGIYLCEFRNHGGSRKIVVTIVS
jgi:secondary thiamine-phosphate synthase enzyme